MSYYKMVVQDIPSVVFTYQTRAPPSSSIDNDLGYIPYRLAARTLTITCRMWYDGSVVVKEVC